MEKRLQSLEDLFVSKVRIKSLRFFMQNPNQSIHLRGAVRELKEEINAVRRELIRMEAMKLIIGEPKGNRRYFSLNLEHPFVNELIGMFHKTYGLGGEIVDNVKKLGEINFACLTPSYTKNFKYGKQVIDLLIVGMVDMVVLDAIVKKAEKREGREIHYTVLKPNEFEIRKRRRDEFLFGLLIQDIVILIGKREEILV